jgi:hypothetical protein
MWIVYLLMFVITALISYLWATGIDKMTEYQKENPDYDPKKGWLDWDDDKSTTEGEL